MATPPPLKGPKPCTTATRREMHVLAELADGYTFVQVGARLGITGRTAREHCGNFQARHNLRNNTAAVAYALRRGWID